MGVCSAWLEFPYTTELHIQLSLISSFPFFLFFYFFQPFGEIFCFLSLEAYSHFDSGVWNSEAGGRAAGERASGRAGRQDKTGRQIGRQAGLCFFPQAKLGRLSLLIKIANREHLFLVFQLIDLLFAIVSFQAYYLVDIRIIYYHS